MKSYILAMVFAGLKRRAASAAAVHRRLDASAKRTSVGKKDDFAAFFDGSRRADVSAVVVAGPVDASNPARCDKVRKLLLSQHRDPALIDTVIRSSLRQGVPPIITLGVIREESDFNRRAKSRVGAQGLMQLMPATVREMGVCHPYNARENVRGGIRYLKSIYNEFGAWRKAIAAYNEGPGALKKHKLFAETKKYVTDIRSYCPHLRQYLG